MRHRRLKILTSKIDPRAIRVNAEADIFHD